MKINSENLLKKRKRKINEVKVVLKEWSLS